jgi:hypothetical protein
MTSTVGGAAPNKDRDECLSASHKDDLLEDLYLTIRKLMEHHGMTARGIRQSVTRAPNLKPQ